MDQIVRARGVVPGLEREGSRAAKFKLIKSLARATQLPDRRREMSIGDMQRTPTDGGV
jgi:hypothetical protein